MPRRSLDQDLPRQGCDVDPAIEAGNDRMDFVTDARRKAMLAGVSRVVGFDSVPLSSACSAE